MHCAYSHDDTPNNEEAVKHFDSDDGHKMQQCSAALTAPDLMTFSCETEPVDLQEEYSG